MSDKPKATETDVLALYKSPFRYAGTGYIHDAEGSVVSDQGDFEELHNLFAARIRGWGRVQYLNNVCPFDLQDRCGEVFAKALTEYWENNKEDA